MTPRRALATLVIGATLGAGVLTGCGVRLDTAPPEIPRADAAQDARQRTVLNALGLADALDAAGPTLAGATPEAVTIATRLRAQAEALGGAWTPPVRPDDPSPSPWQPDGLATAVGADAPSLVTALVADGARLREDAAAADGDLRLRLASLSISRVLDARALADAAGVACPGCDPAAPADAWTPAAADPVVAAPLVRTLDALGYAQEAIAARSSGEVRASAVTLAAGFRARAEALAQAAGIAGSAQDPRAAAYPFDRDDPAATVAALTADLLPQWLALYPAAEAADRDTVLDLATAAAIAAPTPAPFPGLQ